MDPAYEHRTVAFVDILGFADLVRRSVDDASFLAKLNHALRIVEPQGRAWAAQSASAGAGRTAEDTDFRSQVFSDCIVLSQRGADGIEALLRLPLADSGGVELGGRGAREVLAAVATSYEYHGGFRLRTLSA